MHSSWQIGDVREEFATCTKESTPHDTTECVITFNSYKTNWADTPTSVDAAWP